MNLKDPELYINRELSWLKFNTRVLQQAQDTKLPLLERLKFLAIYGTNLDEFYMIRVAGLQKLFTARIIVTGADHLTPLEQLKSISGYLHNEQKILESTFNQIISNLENEQVYITNYEKLNDDLKQKATSYFKTHIYPVVVPIAVDSTHPFPHLNNLSFGLVLKLKSQDDEKSTHFGLVRIPRVLSRFIEIEAGVFVTVESIVAEHAHELFMGFELLEYSSFRVTRNADFSIEEEEADDFMQILQEGLKLRRKGTIIRLEVDSKAPVELIEFLNRHIHVHENNIYYLSTPLNLGSLWQIVSNKRYAHLVRPSYQPQILPPLNLDKNILTILDKKDLILFHPYESFDPVVQFIKSASEDPDVLSIRMTLYRVGSDSPIVKALINAAESGKQVTAMVELKARFDEENNLIWAKALENAGAHVIYGISGFKVHAKATLIVKRYKDGLKHYAHLATGNYNPSTSKVYTDVSYLTSKKSVTNDIMKFFHILTGFFEKGKLDTLFMAPTQVKQKLLSLIKHETQMKEDGHIIAKMNALIDEDVIRALYSASMAGVKIELIVRGICSLRPGVKGVSENIRVISIIGKYLEHARLFYFKNSTPNLFISSADWMTRNLSRRVELLTPIEDEKILQFMRMQLEDNTLSHELQNDGSYVKVKNDKKTNDSQENMEKLALTYRKKRKKDLKK